jgi:hypothetical protein
MFFPYDLSTPSILVLLLLAGVPGFNIDCFNGINGCCVSMAHKVECSCKLKAAHATMEIPNIPYPLPALGICSLGSGYALSLAIYFII